MQGRRQGRHLTRQGQVLLGPTRRARGPMRRERECWARGGGGRCWARCGGGRHWQARCGGRRRGPAKVKLVWGSACCASLPAALHDAQSPLAAFVTGGLRASNLFRGIPDSGRASGDAAHAQRCFRALSRPQAQRRRQVAAAWDTAVTVRSAAAAGLRRLHWLWYGLGWIRRPRSEWQHGDRFMGRAVMVPA